MVCVVFDMDGVLCDLDDAKRLDFLSRLSGKSVDEIREAIWGSGFEDRSDGGEFTADEYLAEFGQRIGYSLSPEEWIGYRRSGMTPDLKVIDLAHRVKKKGATTCVLTNNGMMLKSVFPLVFPDLEEPFGWDKVYCSAEFKIAKPNPLVFHQIRARIADQSGAQGHEFYFVDDRIENVRASEEANFRGIHYTDAESLQRQLRGFGLI